MSAKKKAAPGLQPESLCYVGPSFVGSPTGTIYTGGELPVQLKDLINKKPEFKSLVVPVGVLAKANADLDNPASAISITYRAAKEYIRKDGI